MQGDPCFLNYLCNSKSNGNPIVYSTSHPQRSPDSYLSLYMLSSSDMKPLSSDCCPSLEDS